ncbi:MAG: murein biosynthesis integral membrane protein MurJ [Bacillota bacterium]|nr:murein biosynthesis integral membrane protein MurJ [Bacillota bacterium]
MTNVKNVAKYSAIITGILIISKGIGFIREFVIAVTLGATRQSDIFKIATTMPNVFLSCISAVLVTAFIPIFASVKEDREKADTFFNNVFNFILIICIVLSILGVAGSPILIKLFAGGFKGNDFNSAVFMTKITMPSIIFLALSGLYTGYLQSYGVYLQPAMTGIISNIVIIVGLVCFSKYGITAAVIAFLISSIAQMYIQRPFMHGYKYKFFINIHDKNLKRIVILGLPMFINNIVSQVNLMVDKNFASRLVAGSISVVDYASKLSTIINQVFIVSITTVLYPMLTEKFVKKDKEGFESLFNKTVNLVILVAIPMIVGMIILSTPLVKIFLEHGKFDANATAITSLCLKYLAVSTLGYAFLDSLSKIFFSANETVIPMINGFIQIVINIVLIITLVPKMGVSGLALANTLSSLIIALLMFIELRYKLPGLKYKKVIVIFIKVVLASAVMGVILELLFKLLNSLFLNNSTLVLALKVIIVSVVAVLIYIINLKLLKVDELNSVISFKFLKKRSN